MKKILVLAITILAFLAVGSLVVAQDAHGSGKQMILGVAKNTGGPSCSFNSSSMERETFLIPHEFYPRAQEKARLMNLLRQSLLNDAKGIVDVKLEKEIKKLEKKLEREPL